MIPAEFEYFAPGSVKEAVALLAQTPGAKLLSGGMSLIPALKHRLVEPAALIDIGRIPGLDQISERRGAVSLGACMTHACLPAEPLGAVCARMLPEGDKGRFAVTFDKPSAEATIVFFQGENHILQRKPIALQRTRVRKDVVLLHIAANGVHIGDIRHGA